jgi:hypothetical protein
MGNEKRMKRYVKYGSVLFGAIAIWCGLKLRCMGNRTGAADGTSRTYDSLLSVFFIVYHDVALFLAPSSTAQPFYCTQNGCNKEFLTTNVVDKLDWIVAIWPWYSLMVFGCYCLYRLGSDIISFNDYPEEITKLEKDILIAREDLKKRGFSAPAKTTTD